MSVYDNIYKTKFDKVQTDAKTDNDLAFVTFYEINRSQLVSSILFKNLPEHIYYTRPMQHLFYKGRFAAFYDDEGNIQMFPCIGMGTPRDDLFFSQYQMWSPTGKTWIRNFEDIEICEATPFGVPLLWFVEYFTKKMSEAVRTIDINNVLSRGVALLKCKDEAEKAMIADFYKNCEDGIPISAVVSERIDDNITNLNIFDNNKNSVLDSWEIFDRWLKLYQTTMGFAEIDEKGERMLNAEINVQNDMTGHGFFESIYISICDFVRRYNEHFNQDLYVIKNRMELNDSTEEVVEELFTESEEMEELNELIEEKNNDETVEETETEETETEEEIERKENEENVDE